MMIHILGIKAKTIRIIFIGLFLAQWCFGQEANANRDIENDTARLARNIQLKDVVVTAKQPVNRNNLYQYLPDKAKSLVTVLGGTDIMRYIGILPGVSQGMEGGMGFFVRGSNTGNNRVELDEVPIYGTTHLFGLFSTFHPDIVSSTDFRTGGIPASSGDFLASIAQIKSINPDSTKFHGSFSISPFLTGVSTSGSLNNKIGFVAAGRISLLRPEYQILKSFTKADTDVDPEIADLYLKLNYRIDRKNLLCASGYISNDYFNFVHSTARITMNWGNQFARIGWDWNISEKTKLHTLAYIDHFLSGQLQRQYKESANNELSSELRMQSSVTDAMLQSTVMYLGRNWNINTGFLFKSRIFKPASEKLLIGADNASTFINSYQSQSYTVFTEAKYKLNKMLTSLGLRENLYRINSFTKILTDIRLNSTFEIDNNSGLEFSYDLLSQTHHSIEGLPMGWSLDLLIPADKKNSPERSGQFYAGGYWSDNIYSFSAGAYYKHMDNLISYKNSTNLFGEQNTSWQEEIAMGQGKSYGVEFHAERRSTIWSGSISYTLSKTTRRFNDINDGIEFPFKFDRRHILNLNSQVRTKIKNQKEQHFNFSLTYSSGHNATIPIGEYKGITLPYWDLMNHGSVNNAMDENAYYRQLMSEKNNYELPYYFRVDFGYSFLKRRNKFTSELTFGVYNVLNRHNAFLIFYQDYKWKQLSILPIIPSVQWNICF